MLQCTVFEQNKTSKQHFLRLQKKKNVSLKIQHYNTYL